MRRTEEELPVILAAPPGEEPVLVPPAPLEQYDVVQVCERGPHYGELFIVGDVQHKRAHGFKILKGGQKEYITVSVEELSRIGPARVRSSKPCSPKWTSDYGR